MVDDPRVYIGIVLAAAGALGAGFFVSHMIVPLPDYPAMLGLGSMSPEAFFLSVVALFAGTAIALRYSSIDVLPLVE